MRKILLLLKNGKQRQTLLNLLANDYHLIVPEQHFSSLAEFDLCIIDHFHLKKHYRDIIDKKSKGKKFLSVMSPAHRASLTTEIAEVIDDLIFTPLSEIELKLRVSNLVEKQIADKPMDRSKDDQNYIDSPSSDNSDHFFQLIFDNSPDAIFIHPWEEEGFGKFIHVNRIACERYGYSLDEFLKLTPADISAQTDVKKRGSRKQREFLAQHQIHTFEAVHITKDGREFPVEIRSIFFWYKNMKAVLSIARDISDRKKAEIELKRSENRYRMLFENSPVPLWEEDYRELMEYIDEILASGVQVSELEHYFDQHPQALFNCAKKVKILQVNQAALKLHDAKSAEELFGELDKIFVAPQSFEVFKREIISLVKGEKSFTSEAVVKTLKGEIKDVLVKFVLSPEHDVTGKLETNRFILSTMDISPLKNAQRALEKSLKELDYLHTISIRARKAKHAGQIAKEVVSVIKDAINPDVCLFYLRNGAKLNLIGHYLGIDQFALEEAKIHKVGECLCGIAVELNKSVFSLDIFSDARCTLDECKNANLNSFAAFPLVVGNSTIGIIGIGSKEKRDFEDQKAFLETLANETAISLQNMLLVEELREHKRTLEQKVRDRTAELKEINEELESFSYSVSHDLRAPLRAIDGFSAILEEKYLHQTDKEAKRLIGVVRKNVQRMSELIDDLLTFSRVGRKKLEFQKIDMNAIFIFAFDAASGEQPRQKIAFNVHKLPFAYGDKSLILQVATNLVSNAIKFSSTRKVPTIEVGSFEKKGEIVYFVKDNGVGFDMKYAGKLFQVFQRLHSEKEFPGTGIGLSLVQRIIMRHGGKVWAESKPDKGATFFFSLPLRQAKI